MSESNGNYMIVHRGVESAVEGAVSGTGRPQLAFKEVIPVARGAKPAVGVGMMLAG